MTLDPDRLREFAQSYTEAWCSGHPDRVSEHEEWTIDSEGLIADSQGHFDKAEYDRQLSPGVEEPQ